MLEIKTSEIESLNYVYTSSKTCHCCSKEIITKTGLFALNKYWHEDCLKCDKCNTPLVDLGDRFYERNGKVLCKWDYLRLFGQSGCCKLCKKNIPPTDYVLRFHNNNYHVDCFKCNVCNYRFCVGEQVFIPEPHYVLCSTHILEYQHYYFTNQSNVSFDLTNIYYQTRLKQIKSADQTNIHNAKADELETKRYKPALW